MTGNWHNQKKNPAPETETENNLDYGLIGQKVATKLSLPNIMSSTHIDMDKTNLYIENPMKCKYKLTKISFDKH